MIDAYGIHLGLLYIHLAASIPDQRERRRKLVERMLWALDHWGLIFSIFYGMFMIAPFFAPVFMHIGWIGAAQSIYTFYSFLCHQMAQRCFFLFGSQPMYNLAQLPISLTGGDMVADMLAVRAFQGNPVLGWKVAWSDRMVYMYGAVWLSGMIYGVVRHRRTVRPLSLIGFGLLMAPMLLDGGTHWLSDTMGGLGSGFRYDNQWLATLTGNILPHWFYYGDALGSFNS